jgi:signal peptidase II
MTAERPPSLRLLLALAILISCVGCDQATKAIAIRTLADGAPKSFLAGTIRLDVVLNPGGFLGLGSHLPGYLRMWTFLALNVCIIVGLLAFLLLKRDIPLGLFLPLAFILAGGIGNLIDRVGNGGFVTDFINIGIGPLRTGVFNVADMAITLGCIAVAYLSFRRDADERHDASEPRARGD